MKTYKIRVSEVVSGVFDVEGNSIEEALSNAAKLYLNGEIVNEPGELIDTLFEDFSDTENLREIGF